MLPEDPLDVGWIKPLQDVADRSVSRCAAPRQAECRVQPTAMHINESDDASIRVAASHDGKNGKQQDVGKLIFPPLSAAGIGNSR